LKKDEQCGANSENRDPREESPPFCQRADSGIGRLFAEHQKVLRAQGFAEINDVPSPNNLVQSEQSNRRHAEATRFCRAEQKGDDCGDELGLEPARSRDRVTAPVEQKVGQ
jgi:hypothetical protein